MRSPHQLLILWGQGTTLSAAKLTLTPLKSELVSYELEGEVPLELYDETVLSPNQCGKFVGSLLPLKSVWKCCTLEIFSIARFRGASTWNEQLLPHKGG